MWWFLTILISCLFGGAVGFILSDVRYRLALKSAAEEYQHQVFLTSEANEHQKAALELSNVYEKNAKSAEESAAKAAKDLKNALKTLAKVETAKVVEQEVKKGIRDAVKKYKEQAEAAAEKAEEAVADLSRYRKEWAQSIKLAKEEAISSFIMRQPSPCEVCEGIGFYVGGNNQKYDCKHCEDGVIFRVISVD